MPLGKVQAIHQVSGRGISAPKRGKVEVLLGKAQDRGELERSVVDVTILRVVPGIGIQADLSSPCLRFGKSLCTG